MCSPCCFCSLGFFLGGGVRGVKACMCWSGWGGERFGPPPPSSPLNNSTIKMHACGLIAMKERTFERNLLHNIAYFFNQIPMHVYYIHLPLYPTPGYEKLQQITCQLYWKVYVVFNSLVHAF